MNARTAPSSSQSSSIPMGSFKRFGTMAVTPTIHKKTETFAAKRKRVKDYSSDSSGTEKDAGDGHVENRIYRAKGESYDFYVYHQGKKITFGDSVMHSTKRISRLWLSTTNLYMSLCHFLVSCRACPIATTTTRLAPTSTRGIRVRRRRTSPRCVVHSKNNVRILKYIVQY